MNEGVNEASDLDRSLLVGDVSSLRPLHQPKSSTRLFLILHSLEHTHELIGIEGRNDGVLVAVDDEDVAAVARGQHFQQVSDGHVTENFRRYKRLINQRFIIYKLSSYEVEEVSFESSDHGRKSVGEQYVHSSRAGHQTRSAGKR